MAYLTGKEESDLIQWGGVALFVVGILAIGWILKIAILDHAFEMNDAIVAGIAFLTIGVGVILMGRGKKGREVIDSTSQLRNNK